MDHSLEGLPRVTIAGCIAFTLGDGEGICWRPVGDLRQGHQGFL